MREIRQSGSEGGVADNGHPYPYLGSAWVRMVFSATRYRLVSQDLFGRSIGGSGWSQKLANLDQCFPGLCQSSGGG